MVSHGFFFFLLQIKKGRGATDPTDLSEPTSYFKEYELRC